MIKTWVRTRLSYFSTMNYRRSFAKDELDKRLEPFLCKKGGFFVEAGANDGIRQSNTMYFERYFGWSGILIEPVPALATSCKKNRPNCIVEAVALTNDPTQPTIEIVEANLMSITAGAFSQSDGSEYSAKDHLRRAGEFQSKSPSEFVTKTVPCKTLTQIFQDHNVKEIDLLSLDVEGFESQALAGLDLSQFRPQVILVEERKPLQFRDLLAQFYKPVAVLSFHPSYQDTLYRRN